MSASPKTVLVVAALIETARGVLVCQRDAPPGFAGWWEFPGGKIDPEESPEESLAREIREELTCEVEAESLFDVVFHRYRRGSDPAPPKDFNILMLVYRCRITAGQPRPEDHRSLAWCPRENLGDYAFLPADRPVVARLQASNGSDGPSPPEEAGPQPRLYGDLASWWPLMSAPADYAPEAEEYASIFLETLPEGSHLLELGCGGGNNACHLKGRFRLTLSDRSAAMLETSRRLNPRCEHVEGDMRSLRLERRFDGVFLHDAIMYLVNEADLAAAMETAWVHCRPGGVALFVPDCVAETFRPATHHGGHDGEGKAMRYLAWTRRPRKGASRFATDFAYLLAQGDGPPRLVADRHENGLFSRKTWLDLLTAQGFEVQLRKGLHGDDGPCPYEVFIARRPA